MTTHHKLSDVIQSGFGQRVSLATSPAYRENSDQVMKTHVWTALYKDRCNTDTASLFLY